jgi:hypothetical protein
MSAPTPWSGTIPLLFTGSYLTRTPGTGNLYVGSYASAGGGGTVFDDLVNPPATGVAAEEASLAWAQGVGSTATTSPNNGKPWYSGATAAALVAKNFDFVLNFYLEASIARNSSGVPIF